MRTYLTIAFFLFTNSLIAQPYKSMFGTDSTQWRMYMSSTAGGDWIDDYAAEKDTSINGLSYKKVVSEHSWYFFREDLVHGKIWLRQICDTGEVLFMDYTLQKGDTLKLQCFANVDTAGIIDSIFTVAGRKHFRLKMYDALINEQFEFIEGVGWNEGFSIIGGCASPQGDRLLLCAYQDGQQVFFNKYFGGNCNPLQVKDVGLRKFTISPNPAGDFLDIHFRHPAGSNCNMEIYDANGRKVRVIFFKQGLARERIDISCLLPGLYFLVIPGENFVPKTFYRL